MSLILDTKTLLSDFPHIDQIYTYLIPEGMQSNTTETMALLREVQVQTDEEGNNRFNAVTTQLQLQIFFKLNIDFDTEKFQVDLFRILENNGYEVSQFGGLTADPDTSQLTLNLYLEKLQYTND